MADRQADTIPGRAFLFVLADEVNPLTRKVVRRALVNPSMAAEVASRIGKPVGTFPHPERFGLHPSGTGVSLSPGRHAMNFKPSPFMSASSRPLGAPRFEGSPFWIDVEKAKAAGATIHETDEILDDLARIARKTRKASDLAKIEKIAALVRQDAEVLVRGAVPPTAVKGAGAMAMTRGLQGVQIVGFVMTAMDLANATEKSVDTASIKPLAAEGIRQGGSWLAAWAGIKVGAAAGTAMGITTGPGAVALGAAGAVFGGALGYLGFDFAADFVDKN